MKAGLKNTYYGSKINNLSNECNSYTFNGSLWELSTETDMSIPHGAGAIVSSTKELNTFITALFNMKLISKTSLDEMTNTTDHYGKGIFPMPFYDNTSYGHTGGIDGFSSVLSYFPKDSISVAFCSNGMNYKMNDILIGILNIYYGKAYTLPVFKTINLSIAQLTKYEGVYSKKDFPLKITIKVTDKQLTAQGTGQGAFPLEAVNENEFKFDAAGIIIIFSADGKLNLKQGGGDIEMKKE